MLNGTQTGMLWTTPGTDGLWIEVLGEFSVNYVKIVGGQRMEPSLMAAVKSVYDERQGNDVAGIALLDARGEPTGEVYKLRDFTMSGNVSWFSAY